MHVSPKRRALSLAIVVAAALPAAALAATVDIADRTLSITGDPREASELSVTISGGTARIAAEEGTLTLPPVCTQGEEAATCPADGLRRIRATLNDGADAFRLLGRVASILSGGTGNDELQGGSAGDTISGGAGNDELTGAPGNDRLSGGNGIDSLDGGNGNDRLGGGRDRDELAGGRGNDRLSGNGGNDELEGGPGRDSLNGGSGRDTLEGGAARDRFNAGPGSDRIESRDGVAETVNCGSGRDAVEADRSDRLAGCEMVRFR